MPRRDVRIRTDIFSSFLFLVHSQSLFTDTFRTLLEFCFVLFHRRVVVHFLALLTPNQVISYPRILCQRGTSTFHQASCLFSSLRDIALIFRSTWNENKNLGCGRFRIEIISADPAMHSSIFGFFPHAGYDVVVNSTFVSVAFSYRAFHILYTFVAVFD